MLQDNALVCVFAWTLSTEVYVNRGDHKMMGEFARGLSEVGTEMYADEFLAISANVADQQIIMVFETRAAATDFRDNWHMARARILTERARNKFTDPQNDIPF